jgi:cysteine desulfurase
MWNPFDKTPSQTALTDRIYLDYASATPVLPEARQAAADAERIFGNPGSIHIEGVAAARLLQGSREKIAHELGCKARDIVFTSGGTEANNLAILGFAKAIERNSQIAKTHWIVSSIEHPSVLECFAEIERLGARVDFVDPDSGGIIRPEAVARLLRSETVFVSIGWANGEIGTIQPLAKIARALRAHEAAHASKIVFHCDAGQAPLYESSHVHSLGIDLLTLDSGKLYGPRGIGALYLSDRAQLVPLLLGGKQERGLRAGTENVALAAGFAAAYAVIAHERAEESKRMKKIRDHFEQEIIARMPSALINGDSRGCLPNIVNISIPGINSEYVTLSLDHIGISISTKSACREGEEQQSHVVAALALAAEVSTKEARTSEWRSKNTLRFSFGRETTQKHLDDALDALAKFTGL